MKRFWHGLALLLALCGANALAAERQPPVSLDAEVDGYLAAKGADYAVFVDAVRLAMTATGKPAEDAARIAHQICGPCWWTWSKQGTPDAQISVMFEPLAGARRMQPTEVSRTPAPKSGH